MLCEIAAVYAGLTIGIFFAGKNSLLNSLTREIAVCGVCPKQVRKGGYLGLVR